MAARFKEGDTVLICDGNDADYGNYCWIPELNTYIGEEAVVNGIIYDDGIHAAYKLNIDNELWSWEDTWLKPATVFTPASEDELKDFLFGI